MDDSYPSPGLTVNVFSNTFEELPHIKNDEDMILFIRIKVVQKDSCLKIKTFLFHFPTYKFFFFL